MRTNRKRVTVPFLFRAADGLGANGKLIARAYGTEVEGVFTRAGKKAVSADVGALTVAHSVPPLGTVDGEAALVLESAATNLVIRSQEFGSWTNSAVTVTDNAATAPDGTVTADLLTTAVGGGGSRYQTVTFTGNASKAFGLWLKPGTATRTMFAIYDATAGAYRHQVRVQWSGGTPTLTTEAGAGTLFTPEQDPGTGFWRCMATADGVLAANTNRFYVFPHTETADGTCYMWGAQAEDATALSSYVATEGSTVARVADACYFPFTLTPREMTVYVRGIERLAANVAPSADSGILHIGSATFATDAKLALYRNSGAAGYRTQHDPGTATATSAIGATATIGDTVELRAVLGSTGTMIAGVSINAGTEATNGPSTAQALATAWAANRLYLNSLGSGNVGAFAFTHVCVALGTKTLDEMRALAEVA